jgi:dihydrofolate reductase
MGKVMCGITMSVDGFVAGPNMTEEKPFGDANPKTFHGWRFENPEKYEEDTAYLSSVSGAYVMGRNMYGPSGDDYDKNWKGWWGEEPPFHAPVYVLTHKERAPIEMAGGTTFHFITEGIEKALEEAKKAAGDKPVLIAGGANTINQYLEARLIEELWLHIVPVTIGAGPRMFEGVRDLKMEPLETGGDDKVSWIKYKILS